MPRHIPDRAYGMAQRKGRRKLERRKRNIYEEPNEERFLDIYRNAPTEWRKDKVGGS
jgi:hypothetical protein